MVLLNSEHEDDEVPGQLMMHFRLRGSWLLGASAEERRRLFSTLSEIYSMRSQVAHNGYFSDRFLKRNSHDKRQAMSLEHTDIAERIFRRLITGGTPNWSSLVLGEHHQRIAFTGLGRTIQQSKVRRAERIR